MLSGRIRKAGNSYVVTIPRDEMKRQNLAEGQLVGIDVYPVEIRPTLRPALREAFEASFERNRAGLDYLAGR